MEIGFADCEVRLNRIETMGPAVNPPLHAGFGQFLLQRVLSSDLNGKVQLEFAKAGGRCLITFPIDREISTARDSAYQTELNAAASEVVVAQVDKDRSLERNPSNRARTFVAEDEFILAIELHDSLRLNGYMV
jgi:hypothetical protein